MNIHELFMKGRESSWKFANNDELISHECDHRLVWFFVGVFSSVISTFWYKKSWKIFVSEDKFKLKKRVYNVNSESITSSTTYLACSLSSISHHGTWDGPRRTLSRVKMRQHWCFLSAAIRASAAACLVFESPVRSGYFAHLALTETETG